MRCGIRKKAHSSLQQPRMDGRIVSVNRSIAHRRSEIGLGAVEDAWTRRRRHRDPKKWRRMYCAVC
jgi:hypothetical protein